MKKYTETEITEMTEKMKKENPYFIKTIIKQAGDDSNTNKEWLSLYRMCFNGMTLYPAPPLKYYDFCVDPDFYDKIGID